MEEKVGVGSEMVRGIRLRERLPAAVAVLITIACGLAIRRYLPGAWAEHLGNVAWGVMWTFAMWTVAPRGRAAVLVGAAAAVVAGTELFQLTPYPARWSEVWIVARYTVGGAFELHDLAGGAAGAVLAGVSIWSWRGRDSGASPPLGARDTLKP